MWFGKRPWDESDTHLVVLYTSVLVTKAKYIVELGTHRGLGTSVLSEAATLTGGTVYTIDIDPNPPAKEKLKDRTNVVFINGDSVEVGRKWDKPVDVLFVDSDHRYDHVINELRTWGRHDPKIILIHDIYRSESFFDPYYAGRDYAEETGKKFVVLRSNTCPEGIGVIL